MMKCLHLLTTQWKIWRRHSKGDLIGDNALFIVMDAYSKFPPDVLHNENIMDLLTLCAKRIEHMQVNSISIASQYWLSYYGLYM